jgi:hypothetical protein
MTFEFNKKKTLINSVINSGPAEKHNRLKFHLNPSKYANPMVMNIKFDD